MRIVLDPGHGGKDSGAVGRVIGIKEKDVVLGIAKQLAAKLETAGHQVWLTRDSDVFISLPERVKKMGDLHPDFALSIHVNSSESNTAKYLSAYVAKLDEQEVIQKANSLLQSCAVAMHWPDSGVKKENFYVLRNANFPITLIELGFLSNPEQESLLAKAEIRGALSNALYKALNGQVTSRSAVSSNNQLQVLYNGKVIGDSVLINGLTYVPLRKFAESLGYEVEWNESKNQALLSKIKN